MFLLIELFATAALTSDMYAVSQPSQPFRWADIQLQRISNYMFIYKRRTMHSIDQPIPFFFFLSRYLSPSLASLFPKGRPYRKQSARYPPEPETEPHLISYPSPYHSIPLYSVTLLFLPEKKKN